jgi:hypothetical protein
MIGQRIRSETDTCLVGTHNICPRSVILRFDASMEAVSGSDCRANTPKLCDRNAPLSVLSEDLQRRFNASASLIKCCQLNLRDAPSDFARYTFKYKSTTKISRPPCKHQGPKWQHVTLPSAIITPLPWLTFALPFSPFGV